VAVIGRLGIYGHFFAADIGRLGAKGLINENMNFPKGRLKVFYYYLHHILVMGKEILRSFKTQI
jgi:hypothetical protein